MDLSELDFSDVPKPRPLIQPLHTREYPPFSHMFITVTDGTNLDNCTNTSVFLVFRVHPTIKPVQSPSTWCIDGNAKFNCAYAFDFSGISDDISSFVPVIELYTRNGRFIGMAACKLTVVGKRTLNGAPMTILYDNTPVPINSLKNTFVGTISLTITLGFMSQKDVMDPLSPNFRVFPVHPSVNSSVSRVEAPVEQAEQMDWREIARRHGWGPVNADTERRYQDEETQTGTEGLPDGITGMLYDSSMIIKSLPEDDEQLLEFMDLDSELFK